MKVKFERNRAKKAFSFSNRFFIIGKAPLLNKYGYYFHVINTRVWIKVHEGKKIKAIKPSLLITASITVSIFFLLFSLIFLFHITTLTDCVILSEIMHGTQMSDSLLGYLLSGLFWQYF